MTRVIQSEERVRWGFHMGVCVLVVFSLVALLRATVREALDKNPRFSLKEVVVHTKGALTPQRIVRESGLTDGQNLMAIDLREVRDRIEKLPQVKSAGILRGFDGKLTIDVEQRQPVAWLESKRLKLSPVQTEGGCLVDRYGVVVPCDVLIKDYLTLPVIRDEGVEKVTPGAALKSAQVNAALRLIAEMKKREGGKKDKILRIEVQKTFALLAKFADGAEVTFGIDGVREQIARYSRIRQEEGSRGWQIGTMNLLVEDNIPVTFKNVASVPADGGTRSSTTHGRDRSVARRN